MGIPEPIDNLEILVALTPTSLELMYIKGETLQNFKSVPLQNIKKMKVFGYSIFLKSGLKINHLQIFKNYNEIQIFIASLFKNKFLNTDFNEICLWKINNSMIILKFISLSLKHQQIDLISSSCAIGNFKIKKNNLCHNKEGSTCFTIAKSSQQLFTGNFTGKIRIWIFVEEQNQHELLQIEQMEIPGKQLNFMKLTTGEKSLILGTHTGNVIIYDFNKKNILVNINFDNVIHDIYENLQPNRNMTLFIVSKDSNSLIPLEIDEGICDLIYPFNKKK